MNIFANFTETEDNAPAKRPASIFPPNPLDFDAAKARLQKFSGRIKLMLAEAKGHAVTDKETNTKAIEMVRQAKDLTKAIETKQKEITGPAFNFKKRVDALCKPFKDDLKGIEDNLRVKVNAFQVAEENRRREQERKLREEAERARKLAEEEAAKLRQEAEEKGIDPELIEAPAVVDPVIPEKAINRSESGSASLRKEWTWELEDFAKVPDDWKTMDHTKVNQAVRAGTREIPGIRIFQKQKTVFR